MIGTVGAQRVGKSTLARAFAKRNGVAFIETPGSAIYKELGLDPAADYTLEQRLGIQSVILNRFNTVYAEAAKNSAMWIADRTPLDLAAYLLCDVQRNSTEGNPELGDVVLRYVEECFQMANRYFSLIVLVQPGIAPVPEPGKARPDPAFQEHFNATAFGLLFDPRLNQRHFFLPRGYTDLEVRIKALSQAASTTLMHHHEKLKEAGEPIVYH